MLHPGHPLEKPFFLIFSYLHHTSFINCPQGSDKNIHSIFWHPILAHTWVEKVHPVFPYLPRKDGNLPYLFFIPVFHTCFSYLFFIPVFHTCFSYLFFIPVFHTGFSYQIFPTTHCHRKSLQSCPTATCSSSCAFSTGGDCHQP